MSNLHPHIYVLSLTPGSSYMNVITTWIIFPDDSATFTGKTSTITTAAKTEP
jgi:hypothetical protein